MFVLSSLCSASPKAEMSPPWVDCATGDPLLVSHIATYRSADDERVLHRELSKVEDTQLRERLEAAFEGSICVEDEQVRRGLLVLAGISSPFPVWC